MSAEQLNTPKAPDKKKAQAPTEKQKLAAKALLENVGTGKSTGDALRAAGYSEAIVKNPQAVTRSEGFQQLMREMGVDDTALMNTLKDGLKASKAVVMGVKSDESFVDIQPDYAVRHKYLETGLRLAGLGKPDQGININFNNIAKGQRSDYDLDA